MVAPSSTVPNSPSPLGPNMAGLNGMQTNESGEPAVVKTAAVHVPGTYKCLSKSAATPELEYDPKAPTIVHRFLPGETVEIVLRPVWS